MHALHGRWHADFDDLVQTAAEQALRALPSFRRESELSTWTYRICYRTILRHRRWYARWARRFTLEVPTADAEAPVLDAAAQLEEIERFAELARALDGLSPKRRAVVMLRDIEGLPIPTIADIVGRSTATVRSRLRDGRRDLAKLLRATPYFVATRAVEKKP